MAFAFFKPENIHAQIQAAAAAEAEKKKAEEALAAQIAAQIAAEAAAANALWERDEAAKKKKEEAAKRAAEKAEAEAAKAREEMVAYQKKHREELEKSKAFYKKKQENRIANTCYVDIVDNRDGNITYPYDRPQAYRLSPDKDSIFSGAIDNDVGMAVKLRNCGDDKYSVILTKHNHFGDFDRLIKEKGGGWSPATAYSEGYWNLGDMVGEVSGISIKRIPYDTKAVGSMNVYGIPKWIPGMFHENHHGEYEIKPGVRKDPCPAGGDRYPIRNRVRRGEDNKLDPNPPRYACAYDEIETKIRQVRANIPDG